MFDAYGSTYGRAINGISFQTRILPKFDGYEYTAWYDTTGSGTTTQTIWLARRSVTNTMVGPWEKFNTGSTFINGKSSWDAHDIVSLGISPVDGTLAFRVGYARTYVALPPLRHGPLHHEQSRVGNAGMMNPEQNWLVNSSSPVGNVTYPMFLNNPSGALIFRVSHWQHERRGSLPEYLHPGRGQLDCGHKILCEGGHLYRHASHRQHRLSTSRNPYENNFDFSPDGVLHHTWTYREAADAANHDLDYAYSPDNGVTWFNNDGTKIADTSLGQSINVNSPGIIFKVLDSRQRLINQQAQCVDNDGRVHVLALHRRAEPDAAWVSGDSVFSVVDTAYFHYFRDPITHVWSQRRIPWTVFPVGSRPKLGYDAQGNLYGVYLSYASTNTDVVPGYANGKLVIATASKASQYTDWQIACSLPNDLNGEPLIDQTRLLADNILSVFIQENSVSTGVVGTPLHVFDFAVDVAPAQHQFGFVEFCRKRCAHRVQRHIRSHVSIAGGFDIVPAELD